MSTNEERTDGQQPAPSAESSRNAAELSLPPDLAALEGRLASVALPAVSLDRDRLFYRCGYQAGWRDGLAARRAGSQHATRPSSSLRPRAQAWTMATTALAAASLGLSLMWWQMQHPEGPARVAGSGAVSNAIDWMPAIRTNDKLSETDQELHQRFGADVLIRQVLVANPSEPVELRDPDHAASGSQPASPPATQRELLNELLAS